MKRMHETTDGSKTFYPSSYHHYHHNNYPNHHHYNNNNNSNSNGHSFSNGNGFQQNRNNSCNGSHHQNGSNGGYHPNNTFYRHNNNHGRKFPRKWGSNHYPNNQRYGHNQYNNHPHHQQHLHQKQFHHHCAVQHQQEASIVGGHSADSAVIQIPLTTTTVMEQNGSAFPPPAPPSTPCPDSSASSVKSESNCSEQEEQQQQQPQQQSQQQKVPVSNHGRCKQVPPQHPPPPPVNAMVPAPANFPDYETVQKELAVLSDAVWQKYLLNQQSPEIFQKKMELWRELFDLFKKAHAVNYPRYSLQVVGSTMSGFGSRASDVDICLMIRRFEVDQRIEAVDRLHELQTSLQKIPYMENIELIYAKVPILKFRDRSRNLEVDLNCNNSVGIRNTHLLYCYSQLDWRVKPLVLVVKLWAQFHGINDAKNMTISSYSLVLMVIHYLQFGCKEPVLPCLHQMYPEKFSPYLDVEKIRINESIPKWDSRNNECLGELLLGFLEYYARKFDYARAAVSVRLGCHVPIKLCMQTRSYKNDPHQWKYLCVEEPFDLTNTARSVYDKEAFDRIRGVFFASWQRLVFTRDLETIFHTIPDNDSRAIANRLGPNILR